MYEYNFEISIYDVKVKFYQIKLIKYIANYIYYIYYTCYTY